MIAITVERGPRARRSLSRRVATVCKVAAVILSAALVLFGIMILILYARQRKMYYQPKSPRRGPTPANIGLRHWNLKIDERIDTWWVPAAPGKPTVMLCHGNAGNISHRLPLISVIRQTGLGVVIFDYSGYGNTAGKPTERALQEDARAVWHWMRNRIAARDIIVLGRSLGGGVACDLVHHVVTIALKRVAATSYHGIADMRYLPVHVKSRLRLHVPRALIMDSTFTSMPEAVRHTLPRCLAFLSHLVKDQYASREKISTVAAFVPTVVVHTLGDKTVPFWHAKTNASLAKCPLVVLPRGGHNDGYMRSSAVYQRLLMAISRCDVTDSTDQVT